MNVYVESGFVLTLALQQEDYQAAWRLLNLARQGRIILKLPAFSLSEPFATVQHRANTRHRLTEELRKESRELGRTQPHVGMAQELGRYIIQMAQVLQTQLDAMESVVLDLSATCELLQVDRHVLTRAASYKTAHDLQFPDAIILASVVLDLEKGQPPDGALFISQNFKDFELPSIREMLEQLRCKYLADFVNAVRFVDRPAT